ncbi:hypothetical protein ACMYLY_23765, partial [Salmonella enterica subsp. enterica serovar Enteritidis]|uniref:hypothetical protein n=1 Tax=Salmonella enterica TaxID=28901 RepID=UPI0039E9845D
SAGGGVEPVVPAAPGAFGSVGIVEPGGIAFGSDVPGVVPIVESVVPGAGIAFGSVMGASAVLVPVSPAAPLVPELSRLPHAPSASA